MSLPSQLVAQRPDVRQAEENLHAASAQIGIAMANRLPNFTLTADAGSMALAFSQIFAPGTGFWDLAAGITQPIFEGGTLLHRERAAQAGAYRSRGAISRRRSHRLSKRRRYIERAATGRRVPARGSRGQDAASTTLSQAKSQVQAGYAGYLTLLSAEQAYQQAVINLIQAQANRYADTAALFQALGGGWWNRADIPKS